MPIPRLLTIDDTWERESRRSQRALLSTERAVLDDLDAAASKATDAVLLSLSTSQLPASAKMAALATVRRAAEQYRSDTMAAVLRGRQAARQAALERLQGELSQAAQQLGSQPMQVPPPSDAAEDYPLAQSAGDSLSGTWRAGVAAAVLAWADDPKNSLAERVRIVTRGAAYRRQRIAATEVSRAFNDEHGEGALWLAKTYAPNGQRLLPKGAPSMPTATSEVARLGVSDEEYQQAYAFGRNLTREERRRRALRPGPSNDRIEAPGGHGEGPIVVDETGLEEPEPDIGGLPTWARPLVGQMVQRWEATLDSRTCAFCHGMNGALTLLGKPFPNGYEPGTPHPNCRCISTIIVLTPQVILENERRAAVKTRAVLQAEKRVISRSAQARAASKALIRVKR